VTGIAVPETRYARQDGVELAYQVTERAGDGPDIIYASGGKTPIDLVWDEPRAQRFLDTPDLYTWITRVTAVKIHRRIDEPPR
jgi:hypothetical protein